MESRLVQDRLQSTFYASLLTTASRCEAALVAFARGGFKNRSLALNRWAQGLAFEMVRVTVIRNTFDGYFFRTVHTSPSGATWLQRWQ